MNHRAIRDIYAPGAWYYAEITENIIPSYYCNNTSIKSNNQIDGGSSCE
jgi:hypothetical protein